MKNKDRFATLRTKYENEMTDVPYAEYPRPDMKRDSYMTLNGKWSFSVEQEEGFSVEQEVKTVYSGEILVPFPPESKISGVNKQFPYDATLVYSRRFTVTDDFLKDKVILHFGAVDRLAVVSVNNRTVCSHDGGYLPFSVDVSEDIHVGENTIEVIVFDDLDTDYPYGKQSKKRGGMWYTPISGIWQSVWLESVYEEYICDMRVCADMTSVTINTVGGTDKKVLTIHLDDGDRVYEYTGSFINIDVPDAKLWTPDSPYLYRFTLESGRDRVNGYYAHREVSIKDSRICLNGKPIFMNGVLDQGYYSDGIYLPATPDGYRDDILTMKRLGFNTLRKHIKIEPRLFYYYCDVYGMMVWQDMVNSGKYSFLIDTALPTVFLRSEISHRATKKRREIFESCAKSTVELLSSFPSVVYYTVFNEGWGQYDADRIYRELKEMDPTRIYDATSGWFKKKESDVQSEHIYFKPVKIKADGSGRPIVLSEFGGYSQRVDGHCFNLVDNYGYKLFKNKVELTDGLCRLYKEEIVGAIENGLCASILTQVSDVEDETNGLLTYDREVLKVDEAAIRSANEAVYEAFEKNL